MPFTTLSVHPLTGALGAEIEGVDLARPLSETQRSEIHRAFLEHQVLVFRAQTLTPRQQVDVARLFGTPALYPFLRGHEEAPEVSVLAKAPEDKVNFGGSWHSDTAYKERPDMATLLYARQVPAAGGDTLFANMYLAYEALSSGMKKLIDGVRAIYSSEKGYGGNRAERMRSIQGLKNAVAEEVATFESEHPLVRTHPQTGRRSLYVSHTHTLRLKDMTVEESASLITWLADFASRPEFTCRVRWQADTLAIWDNRCTNHFAVNDCPGHARLMHRVTIEGDRPV